MTGFWINFRNDTRSKEIAERIRTLVDGFVLSLEERREKLSALLALGLVVLGKVPERPTYPTPLEAVLRAEESVDTHFLAFGALKSGSIVFAFKARTFPRLFSGLVHLCDRYNWFALPRGRLLRRVVCLEFRPGWTTPDVRWCN